MVLVYLIAAYPLLIVRWISCTPGSCAGIIANTFVVLDDSMLAGTWPISKLDAFSRLVPVSKIGSPPTKRDKCISISHVKIEELFNTKVI